MLLPGGARRKSDAAPSGASGARRKGPQLGHVAGLDGLRGLAVLAVVLYHAGLGWAGGGFIGVELFFVLSGFLITSLLLTEWWQSATIRLGAFWARRARRLLPALLALLVVIGVYYAVVGPAAAVPGLKDDGLATFLYVGNWHQIATGSSYFAATGAQSPLKHTWSLAIEEQFYLLWPLIVLGVLALAGRRTRTIAGRLRSLRALLALTVVGALASAIDTAILFDGGKGLNRVYYGTDTRAGSLLIGASLAILLALRHFRPASQRLELARVSRQVTRILGLGSVLALAGVIAAMLLAGESSNWLYPYGLVAIDLAAVIVIATLVSRPRALVARILSLRPLRELGKISYGVYLWHYPLFLWLDQSSTGLSGTPLLLLRLAAALGVSIVSYVAIEQPIRRRRIPRPALRALTPVAVGGALAALLIGSALSSISFSDADAQSLPKPPSNLQGSNPPCQIKLSDAKTVGVSPLPSQTATKSEYAALGYHSLTWSGSSTATFHTCPPDKVLMVGDSLGYTLGVGMMENEQRYGTEVDNAALLGCAFTTTGELQVSGVYEGQSAGCPDALQTWAKDAQAYHDNAVVVELGYRDQFDWKIDGTVEHLGEATFDANVQKEIDEYVKVLGDGGKRTVLFLSVPHTQPPANPNGSPSPAASPARYDEINAMIQQAAKGHSNVAVLDLDKIVSPSGGYQATINGNLCRFDGIHFTLYCSELVQPYVLADVRRLTAG